MALRCALIVCLAGDSAGIGSYRWVTAIEPKEAVRRLRLHAFALPLLDGGREYRLGLGLLWHPRQPLQLVDEQLRTQGQHPQQQFRQIGIGAVYGNYMGYSEQCGPSTSESAESAYRQVSQQALPLVGEVLLAGLSKLLRLEAFPGYVS